MTTLRRATTEGSESEEEDMDQRIEELQATVAFVFNVRVTGRLPFESNIYCPFLSRRLIVVVDRTDHVGKESNDDPRTMEQVDGKN